MPTRSRDSVPHQPDPGPAPRLARLLAFAAALSVLSGCGGSAPPDVVLVTIDTLRADHLPFYGYPRQTMPNVANWLPGCTFRGC